MKVLILYATYSSGTQTAAEIIRDTVKSLGHDVTVTNVSNASPEEFDPYNLIIMGSPSWMIENKDGQPHHEFLEYMKKMGGKTYPDKEFAVFGLGDTSYAHFCGAVKHLEEFVAKMRGTLITKSLKIDGFYFNQDANEESARSWVTNFIR